MPERPLSIAVDMPIGLLERAAPGGRECDREARALLGRPRASSVFSPPTRKALAARRYEEVAALNGAGMSKEAFNILPKIREVDALMDAALQDTVVEAHPELAFCRFAGRPMRHNKRTPDGRRERLSLLRRAARQSLYRSGPRARSAWPEPRGPGRRAGCVCARYRRRPPPTAGSRAASRQDEPPRDAKGLRMEIWCG